MLEDQVAFLLQKYLGNYVRGLNKEALKISVWKGDVELTNMQLRPEALNALKLPVKVKAGFLGSVKLKVPWSRLGQEPVLVYLDRILLLAEPATQVEGSSEDAIQEAKKIRVREMEMKLLESQQQLRSEMNTSWLGSLISTIIGNIKLSVTNIHIRFEDTESNPGHPFAAGLTLARLSAVTVDDSGKETFATGGALERIQKSVELERLALYFDSDICRWSIDKPWEELLPPEWSQIFELVNKDGKWVNAPSKEHNYILQPVTGNATYTKLRLDVSKNTGQALQKAAVQLDDVTLSLAKDGYRDILKMADNFAAFNQRLKYAHYRPTVSVKADPKSWWKYAYKVVTDEMKKASGKLSWEQVLRYTRLRKRYVSLYASLLSSDTGRLLVDDNKEIEKLDRELDIEVILQWRMLAHKFVEQSVESDLYLSKKKEKRPWWSFGWTGSAKDGGEPRGFTEEDRERLNKIIGYKEGSDEYLLGAEDKDLMHFCLEIHMKHNASKLVSEGQECLADLSCEGLACNIKTYSEAKIFELKLGSYRLSSPFGLLAESATVADSLVGIFSYKPFDAQVDWSFVAKASPCYMTYLKESIDQVIAFFKSSPTVSQTLALETAAAVQMTIDGVKRTAQQQVTRALKDQSRFLLDLDIAAPKITIPTKFFPDDVHATKLLLDLGNLMLRTQDYWGCDSSEEKDMYLQFNLVLSDVSAFLVDGDYCWSETPIDMDINQQNNNSFLPVIEKCGIVLKLQQIQSENPLYPSTRLAVRLPSLGFHFSPARYHRLMQVAKIFQEEDGMSPDVTLPWNQADFEGWLSVLTWKGVGNREAVWQRRYFCLVGPFLYILENPTSKTYKQYHSLRGKQVHQVPTEFTGGVENVLALYDAGQSNPQVVEDVNALIVLCDSDEIRKTWQNRFQGAIYRASGSAAVTSLSEASSLAGITKAKSFDNTDAMNVEKLFLTGVLDELRICFSCNYQSNQSFKKILLSKESHLFEFRAVGGQVELSIRANNIFIGTLLKSLEIEDQFCCGGTAGPRYLARSFINITEDTTLHSSTSCTDIVAKNVSNSQLNHTDSEDKFFEASDDLDDLANHPIQRQGSMSEYFSAKCSCPSPKPLVKPPSFSRIPGLIPDAELQSRSLSLEMTDTLDSFVKAQIAIYDRSSSHYRNVDNRVMVTLATLSFFCHRPTILAILEFVNAVSAVEENGDTDESISKSSISMINTYENASFHEPNSSVVEEPVAKGLLGKGKTRVIFYLTLNMARAQIFLMHENGTSLATLSQNDLLTDIKVFPSSFFIKAALGNLKISDDSLPSSHSYFWICDMRNPGGRSFVELDFSSFNIDDDDYCGYDYSLTGQLSEVRIVYLNRFVQEVISYFMGLVPSNVERVVKLKDQVTNSEKWVTKTEIEGSPALRLDLSLSRPIILMPRRTDSMDYLELDVLQITVQNKFEWIGGDKNEMNAIHLEMLTIKVKDINLTVGTGTVVGENIIQDVKGLSVVIHRSLRDLLHQIPTTEAAIRIEVLKAALSNREYEITTECLLSNFSETPHIIPALEKGSEMSVGDVMVPEASVDPDTIASESQERETWLTMKVLVAIDLIELSLHLGRTRDSSLASVQATGAWILYKSNTLEEGFLFATLKGFSVIDEREGTKEELRLAIGKSGTIGHTSLRYDGTESLIDSSERKVQKEHGVEPIPSMLIFDATFRKSSTNISLCIQKPKLLVALDFLLAIVEFFVPSVRSMLSNDDDNDPLHITDAIVLHHPIYTQPDSVFFLSPRKPLIVDDERFDHFIYNGNGGKLYLQDKEGENLSSPGLETIVYVGNGKRLQFKNVTIMNGEYLDSCIFLGTDSSYSVSKEDCVFLERGNKGASLNSHEEGTDSLVIPKDAADGSAEFVMELQAIGPELTFHNTSKDVTESLVLSTKVMHANLDVFCRLVMKGDNFEISGNVLGLKVESNGIRVLEPFDTCVKFSKASGKTHIHLAVSHIFMNFSFSILSLFLAVEEDILAFLRMSSKKVSVVCSQFDKVGTIQNHGKDQTYAFWRPRVPSGFAVLGDCLTPLNEPPSKGVLAVNTSFVRVKRPVSYKLIWQCSLQSADKGHHNWISTSKNNSDEQCNSCSVWFPVAPKGYVAVGCVVSAGNTQPPLSAALCILSSLVSPCALKDCIALSLSELNSANIAFWRVENSFGSFLPADPKDMSLIGKPCDLHHMMLGYSEPSSKTTKSSIPQDNAINDAHACRLERSALLTSGRLFQAVASFKLIWWNQGTTSRKKLSIWRPVVPHGMVYLGDLAVQGYEPPNSAIVLHDTGDDTILKTPQDFQLVGHIKKHRGVESISFWLPQAPPGFVALGCVASKGSLKHDEFGPLRCIRSDMVTGDQFAEESIWDTSDSKVSGPFSLWSVGTELGTFLVRSGFRKPPKRFALKLAGPAVSSGSDNTVIDAEIKTFSTAIFDDYGGLMVPLFNMSFENVAFSLHGRPDYLNSTMSFSVSARSFNDKYDSWEPLIEPMDGFLRYQYDTNAPGAATHIRITSTRDLNLNVSVSNANMMFQAYSSWNNLSHIDESYKKREAVSPTYSERSIIDIHHRKNYYIIPQNKLGQDIYIRTTEFNRISNIIKMPSGDNKPVKVPVAKNMLDSHLKGKSDRASRSMVTILIADAELPIAEGMAIGQYMIAVRLFLSPPAESPLQQQSARTCGAISEHSSFGIAMVNWNEMFFFKVDFVDNFMVEFIVVDMGRGEPVGMYSAPLEQIACELPPSSNSYDPNYKLSWKELSSAKRMGHQNDASDKSHGRIRCAVLLSVRHELKKHDKQDFATGRKTGFIQISPAREGPWTTVRLNYAAPAACWRLGNDVVASEVTVRDGNRYVNIRSLVSVTNNTDFVIHLRLKSKGSFENRRSLDNENESGDGESDNSRIETDELFETEKYIPSVGWISCSPCLPSVNPSDQCPTDSEHQGASIVELPDGWEWTDDWHVDMTSVRTADGWVYAPDTEHLKWPESSDHVNSVNYARRRKLLRHRRRIVCDGDDQISVGLLKPGDTMPLPLSGLAHPIISYVLQLRPQNSIDRREYSWSVVLKKHDQTEISEGHEESPEICVSALTESDSLLFCSQIDGTSSKLSQGLWFCLSTQAKEIGKDMNSDPIHDWNLIVNSPISLVNYLPFSAEYSVTVNQLSEENNTCSLGTLGPGETVKIYNADLRDPLYLSLVPEGGWQPIHEPVPISHPSRMPSKMINLRSSLSERIVQIILEQNYDKDRLIARIVRIYVPYWISIARCPPLLYTVVDLSGRREKRHISVPFHSNIRTEKILWQIREEEMVGGYTIASAMNFKLLGFSASISKPGKECFGPVKDLSPLGDMDGSVDLSAYDTDGNCMRLLVSSKPSPYQAVPTKVISIRPYMTFTNRLGEDLYIRFGVGDEPKVLHKTDSRVSFIYSEGGGPDKVQVRLEDTCWCFPVEIVKEDTIIIVLRKHHERRFLRAEVRGYDEGSRFLVVLRLESADGPIRIENRTLSTIINVRQSGLDEDAWIHLEPLSTTKFSWDDPYGQKLLDLGIHNRIETYVQNVNLEKTADTCADLRAQGIQIHVMEFGDIKIVRFTDDRTQLESHKEHDLATVDNWSTSHLQTSTPLELIIELGVVGVSLIDHRPRELLYLYLEKVFLSYSTGYDAGTTSRFKLIIGQLQLDNQLPLTLMPVLLAPEDMPDINHPVFKATITMNNEDADGIQIYPYVYVRVTDKCWRLNIHEPIIWALVDFYNNLRLDSIPSSSNVAQVDPEIRIELIDVSEVRLKLSLETAPTQRPHGVLGMWSPVLSAVGNAFKIQVHLRKVMHRSRFMRKSSIIPAIVNRIRRDLIHNPLHLIFSVDVLGMTKSTLASLSKGFAELSTDGQFLQLRSKQVWSRKITGVGDGILQGTEALAQGVAFGVSGVLRKPVESARQYGILGLAHGLGRAFLGFVVQPLSGALDFVSLTVDGIGASCARCLEILNNKSVTERIRNPRAIHADGVIKEYNEREAVGQMVLYLAEASGHLGCTDLFKEPSKFAWSDYYEDHFIVPGQRIVLITNKRVMLLQCLALDKMDKKPCKILWDVPWEELLALELAKAGYPKPSHVIIHIKNFARSEKFVRLIKCNVEDDETQEPQAVVICSSIRKMWKAHQADAKILVLKVPSSQRHVQFALDETDGRDSHSRLRPLIKQRGNSISDERRFTKHSLNFQKIWSSEQECKSRCTLFPKQVADDGTICSIWRPLCPDGYISVGDIAHVGTHPPHVAAIYQDSDRNFALPMGYDLVWRNCAEDYAAPLSIWLPRPPDGYIAVGCVALAAYEEPALDSAYCAREGIVEDALFEEQVVWSAPDSYPWSCYIYQVQSEALQFIALRQRKEESEWRPMRVSDQTSETPSAGR
ncbi:uncharacterized protein [Elaeis guineensis]|uniref:Uncharacterized protein LOC105043803 isoform X1 n=1 Tax=Elaeis guineensis var. tenera TaxID=51953 RepID=A0A6I9R3E9_ELAGV|nr:uncharacterized protein LOC105043803 isoform X1 [Elaeis guineensis]